MRTMLCAGAVALTLLTACGDETPPGERAETPDPLADADEAEVRDESASPGLMPPAPEYTEDGTTITMSVGEPVSLSFPLPDGVGTNHGWAVEGGTYPDWLDYRGTSTTMQGQLRSNEIQLVASAPGSETLTFVMYVDRESSDERRSVTLVAD